MKLKRWEIALMIGLAVSLALGLHAEASARRLASGLVRLHVVADGDGPEQQAIKLAVRDAVLEAVWPVLDGAESRGEAERRLRALLPDAEAAAREVLLHAGQELPVAVSLEIESFPTREYDTFALPAGEYLSLRVTLGSGQGQNWWCVVFPPLCAAASVEALDEALSSDDRRLITRDGTEYVVRFKLVELWEQIKRGRGGG